jgi:peptidoglycan hydrolase CwlO-like protein
MASGPMPTMVVPPPVQRPNQTPVIVLSIVLVVALAAAITMVILYINQRTTADNLSNQLHSTQQQLNSANSQLSSAKSQVNQLNGQVNQLNGQISTLNQNNSKLTACVNAVQSFLTALNANPNDPNVNQLAKNGDAVCGF